MLHRTFKRRQIVDSGTRDTGIFDSGIRGSCGACYQANTVILYFYVLTCSKAAETPTPTLLRVMKPWSVIRDVEDDFATCLCSKAFKDELRKADLETQCFKVCPVVRCCSKLWKVWPWLQIMFYFHTLKAFGTKIKAGFYVNFSFSHQLLRCEQCLKLRFDSWDSQVEQQIPLFIQSHSVGDDVQPNHQQMHIGWRCSLKKCKCKMRIRGENGNKCEEIS